MASHGAALIWFQSKTWNEAHFFSFFKKKNHSSYSLVTWQRMIIKKTGSNFLLSLCAVWFTVYQWKTGKLVAKTSTTSRCSASGSYHQQ